MKNIDNIKKITEFNEENYAYIYISTFDMWVELYQQILNTGIVLINNREAWEEDWAKGLEYVRHEFEKKLREGYVVVHVYKTIYDDMIKLSFPAYVNDGLPTYYLTKNAYGVDLI